MSNHCRLKNIEVPSTDDVHCNACGYRIDEHSTNIVSNPLDDFELREVIRKALIDNMGLISYEASLDAILSIINTQKRLYAESVIGEYEGTFDKSQEQSASSNYWRNQLREEQRARIK